MSDGRPPSVFPVLEEHESIRPVDWMATDQLSSYSPLFDTSSDDEARRAAARERLSETAPDELDEHIPAPSIPPDPRLKTPPPGSTQVVAESPKDHAEVAAARAELTAQKEAFGRAACELATARAHVIAGVEEELVGLAVEIAQAILEDELAANPEHHRTLARAALRGFGEPQQVRLRASERAFDALTDAFGQTTLEVDQVTVEIHLDPSLAGLGCVAEAPDASIDGTLEARLTNVRRALADEAHRRRAEVEG